MKLRAFNNSWVKIAVILAVPFLYASELNAEDSIFPEGFNIISDYSVSSYLLQVGDTLTITRLLSNQDTFDFVGLYLSENLPPEFEMESCQVTVNDLELPITYSGPWDDNIMTGYQSYHWLLDEPGSELPLDRHLMTGETLRIEYFLTCMVPGTYALPFHTACFYGNGSGFFALGDSVSVAFLNDPDCGDINGDLKIDILDIVYLINFKYKAGPPPDPQISADFNQDGEINILDVVYLINFLYKGGPLPIC